jgi:hypothetical protein
MKYQKEESINVQMGISPALSVLLTFQSALLVENLSTESTQFERLV